MKKGYLRKAVSIFIEKISNTRKCVDVFIPNYWCACDSMKEIDLSLI